MIAILEEEVIAEKISPAEFVKIIRADKGFVARHFQENIYEQKIAPH
jgi:hypothetical protein